MHRHFRQRLLGFIVLTMLLSVGLTRMCGRRQEQQTILNRRLIDALAAHDIALSMSLVNQGADPDTRSIPLPVPTLRQQWFRLLHPAARPENGSPTALLIVCGVIGPDNDTPRAIPLLPGAPALVRCMLDHGANVNARDEYGWTPLIAASNANVSETIRLLIDRGAEVLDKDIVGRTALWFQCGGRPSDTAQLLLEHGADVNAVGPNGTTPFWIAVSDSGPTELEDLLLAHGADVNIANDQGITPLMAACLHGKSVRPLLDHGARINDIDSAGDTALQYAVRALDNSDQLSRGAVMEDNVRQLLARGADPKLRSKAGIRR